MFEQLSYSTLQHYWWFIISLLGAFLVFLFFVQGGQTLFYRLGKTEKERELLIHVMSRKWEFTFTTLVTFGGAFFAAFPLFYSVSFGGAYWVWIIILFAFVLQAVSYKFRNKPGNFFGTRVYEIFLFINGLVGTTLLGVAVATFFTGSAFELNVLNHVAWATPYHGLEAALNIHNLSLGFSVFFLSRLLGLLYYRNAIEEPVITCRIMRSLWVNTILFLIPFLYFLIGWLRMEGYAVDADGQIYKEGFKYLHNLIDLPQVLVLLIIGILSVLYGIIRTLFQSHWIKGIWYSGVGVILTVLSLFLTAGYNNTSFYPSLTSLQDSLTIENASSSQFTLTVMSYVSLLVPFVLAYIFYAWRAIDKGKINHESLKKE
jgi:cytochrome d ubiquinol oxidase subunit II